MLETNNKSQKMRKEDSESISILENEMENMIRKLYCNLIQEEDPADKGSREMKQEILNLLKEEGQFLEKKEYEKYRDKAFQAAAIAEEYGFEKGFRFAFQLLVTCFKE